MAATVSAPTWHYPAGFADRPAQRAGGRPRVTARIDNATPTPENQRHWWGADGLSAKAANTFSVRRRLRNRSRYEAANNPYLFGIVAGNAGDLVGTGPTLQVQTPSATYNREVEAAFNEWAAEVDLVEKLRTCKLAKTVDGEGFLILKNAPSLEHPVKLYPQDVEADQVTTPSPLTMADFQVDGVVLDPVTDRPTHFHVMKHHPGDLFFPDLNPLAVAKVAAQHVVHWFPKLRPGQARGLPVFTPSLDLFVEMRAYRKAVVKAAETAADFAAVLEQERGTAYEGEDDDSDDDGYEAFKRVPIDRGMFTMLPPGAKLGQLNPAQPATAFEAFAQVCLGEAVRPLAYPLNLALGSSQKFNFSSAKLDHINYRSTLGIERADCDRVVLMKVYRAWWLEALLTGAVRPWDGLKPPPAVWHWPGFEPLDAMADAQADAARIAGGMLTWQEFWARRGKDHKDVFAQLAAEMAEIEKLGLTFGDVVKQTVTQTDDAEDDGGDGGGKTEKKPAAGRRGKVRAGERNPDDIERAEDGKFGKGGGGGSDASGDHDETHDRWTAEDEARDDHRQAEDDAHEEAYDRVGQQRESSREKEDAGTEKARAAQDKGWAKGREKEEKEADREADKADRENDRATAAREKAREKEDVAVEKARAKEDAALAKRQQAEDDALGKTHDAENAAVEKARAKEDAGRDDDVDEDTEEARAQEDEQREERQSAELDAQNERHAAEDEAAQQARDAEDADRQQARDAEDEAADAAFAESQEKAADANAAKWDKEDADREAARDAEDAQRQEARDAEDEAASQQFDREAAARDAAREAEDADRYHARKKADPDAHDGYHDEATHKKHAKKAEAGRRRRYARAR